MHFRAIIRTVARLAVTGLLLVGPLAFPAAAAAGGGCSAVLDTSSGAHYDLASATDIHLLSTDQVHVTAAAATAQDSVIVYADVAGYRIPMLDLAGVGSATSGEFDFDAGPFAAIARSAVVSVASSGAGGACSGEIRVVFDDVAPFATPVGLVSASVTVVGVLALGLGLAGGGGVLGRFVSIVGLALAGAGGGIALGQLAGLTETVPASAFAASLPSPTAAIPDLATLALAAATALIVVFLMLFPGELFNATAERHRDEIRGWIGRLPVLGGLARAGGEGGGLRRNPIAIVAYLVLAGILAASLDPAVAPDVIGLTRVLATVMALVAVSRAMHLPRRALQRSRNGDRGKLEVLLGTLPVAILCVAISRVTGYLPGYLYGLVLGFEFAKDLTVEDEGRAIERGAWWMLLLVLAGWLTLDATRVPGVQDTLLGSMLANVLAAICVAGIESVVFALAPLRFLPGSRLFAWSRARWSMVYAVAVAAFVIVIVAPEAAGGRDAGGPSVGIAIGLFVAFTVLSLGFWGFFRVRDGRTPAAAD